jgi:hypothetical protein
VAVLDAAFYEDTLWDLIPELAVGGATWAVSHVAGDGVSASRLVTSAGLMTLYVVQEVPSRLAQSLAATEVLGSRWALIGRTSGLADLHVDDVLTSAEDNTLAFIVTGLDTTEIEGVTIGALSRTVAASTTARTRLLRQGAQLGLRQGF